VKHIKTDLRVQEMQRRAQREPQLVYHPTVNIADAPLRRSDGDNRAGDAGAVQANRADASSERAAGVRRPSRTNATNKSPLAARSRQQAHAADQFYPQQ
jgi:hypothetical protein